MFLHDLGLNFGIEILNGQLKWRGNFNIKRYDTNGVIVDYVYIC